MTRRQSLASPANLAAFTIVAVALGLVALRLYLRSRDLGPAPDFSFSVYQGEQELGGSELHLSDLFVQGKPLVLNFWGGSCPPCRQEMPDIQRVYESHGDEALFLGLDVGPFTGLGTRRSALSLLRELNITYPSGTPPDRDAALEYRITDLPTTVFISRDGNVVRRWEGSIFDDELEEIVVGMVR